MRSVNNPQPPGTHRQCDNCGKPMVVPASATNKRFCGVACRQAWHSAQRAEGLRLLAQARSEEKAG